MNHKSIIEQFSPHLFWDVNRDKLDIEKNKDYMIKQVLEYGLMNDWLLIKEVFGLNAITEAAKTFRTLDKKALTFVSTISNIPLHSFRCYNLQQSTPRHWNF